jgi:hypothetical protein
MVGCADVRLLIAARSSLLLRSPGVVLELRFGERKLNEISPKALLAVIRSWLVAGSFECLPPSPTKLLKEAMADATR